MGIEEQRTEKLDGEETVLNGVVIKISWNPLRNSNILGNELIKV